MPSILFYGVPHGCSFGSIVAAEWLNEPYKLCRIDMPVSPEDTTYVKINRQRQTPALLLPDREVLNESLAILQHLAAKDLSKQLGFQQGTREFDRLNYVLAYLHASFHTSFLPIFSAHKMADDLEAQKSIQEKGKVRVKLGYDRLEALLQGKEWLVGDSRTVADAYFYGVARWGVDLGLVDMEAEYPRVYRHFKKLEQDKAIQFAKAIEDGKPASSSGQFLGHVTLDDVESLL